MSADLRRLAEPVAARLRSGAAITSITQVVQELIENSLDAGARAVSISVHIAQGYVEVADDGAGMSLNDLARCGTRHCTSKIQSVDDLRRATTLGFRGEALASIGDIAVLTVCTRSHNSAETHEKWIKGSVTLSVGPSATSRRAGTTVTVRELFCTVPVRQRALGSEQTVRRELAACRAVLTQLALTRGHCGVTFSLYDAASRRSVLRTERALSQLSCFEQLFGREQATKLMRIDDGGEDSNRQHHEIGILRGYLSRPGCGYHSKELQFISINGRPFGTTKLHSCINARLRQLCQGPSQLLMRRQATADVHEGGRGVAPAPHLPANSIGRTYPLFVLELVLQPRYYDVTLAKMAHLPHEAQVCKLVEAALDQFVQEHQRLAKPSLPLPPFSKETEVGVDPPQFSWRLTSPPATRRHHTVASPDVPNPEPVTMTPPPQAPPSSAANLPSSIESRAVTIETEIATATTTITAAMLSPLATLDILPASMLASGGDSGGAMLGGGGGDGVTVGSQTVTTDIASQPMCRCNLPAASRCVSKPTKNIGRQFWCCPRSRHRCEYFSWAEWEPSWHTSSTAVASPALTVHATSSQRHGTIDQDPDSGTLHTGMISAMSGISGAVDSDRPDRSESCFATVDASSADDGHRLASASAVLPVPERPGHGATNLMGTRGGADGGSAAIAAMFDRWRNPCFRRDTKRALESDIDSIEATTNVSRERGPGLSKRLRLVDAPVVVDLAPGEQAMGPRLISATALSSVSLRRDSLRLLRVVGQFDKRVIMCTLVDPAISASQLLVAVDQHAADERVQLELLQAQVYGTAGSRRLYSTTHITAQWPFDPHEVVSLREYAAHMQHWGFHYEVSNEASTLVQMRAVPRIVGVQLDQRHMRKMLEQLVANGAEQPAAAISKPQAFQIVLAYKACHAAVRFGDALSKSECDRIIEQLSSCQAPFQCAHGRPTVTPLLGLC